MRKTAILIPTLFILGAMTCAAQDSANIQPPTVSNQEIAPSNTTTLNPDSPWGGNSCSYYYSNHGNCSGDAPGDSGYVAKNYSGQCGQGQVMVGFKWGTWGNRYALKPICANNTNS
jgi:hypothetical protein